MPRRPCIVCGTLTLGASRCPAHAGRSWAGGSTRSWRSLRAAALLRDGHACTRCGSAVGLSVHHVVPKHAGGTDTPGNLLTLCAGCHGDAHGPRAA